MKTNIEELRKKYIENPPEGMTSKDIRLMSEDDLEYFKEVYRISPENLEYSSFTVERIEGFLNWLESNRNVSIKTCNQRLAAIHAFFRYIQYRDPAGFEQTSRILTIP